LGLWQIDDYVVENGFGFLRVCGSLRDFCGSMMISCLGLMLCDFYLCCDEGDLKLVL